MTDKKDTEFQDRRSLESMTLAKAKEIVAQDQKEKLQALGKRQKEWFQSLTNETAGQVAIAMDSAGIMDAFRPSSKKEGIISE